MQKKFGKDDIEYCLMKDFWKTWEDNGITESSDDYWNKLIANMQAVSNKYKGTKREDFARNLMVLLADELDREHRAIERT